MQEQACDACHRRKSRCDKVKPACGYCQKSQVKCQYSDRSREPRYRREHVEALEKRLRQSQARNKTLADELAQSKESLALPKSRNGYAIANPTTPSIAVSSLPSTTSEAPDGDVINEVTFLASTAAGERHYLGSTSGILFANLVRASVSMDVTKPSSPPGRSMEEQQKFQNSNCSTSTISKDHLPLQELARELFLNYISHDHICYPFLSPRILLSILDSVYKHPSFYVENAFESFVFDLILAIATANVYKSAWQMLPSAETHHTRAMLRVTEVFQAGGLKSLQAILLLCQYRTGSSMQDTSASMWHLVGIAVRICFELGLHRESTYSIKLPSDDNSDRLEALIEQETRRRCFWCVFAMDRIVGMTLGRPMAIHLEDIDVKLPPHELDHNYAANYEECGEVFTFNRTDIFVHITQYRLLCGKITKCLHGPKRPDQSESQIRSVRDSLVLDLENWRRDTDRLDLPNANLPTNMSHTQSSFRSSEWYEMLYCNAMLFLYRPSPMLADISRDSKSLQNIFLSSKRSIALYAHLHRSRKINYSWITLHSVFMAGLSYIYAVSGHFRAKRSLVHRGPVLVTDPTAIEIVNDTRACSNVLVAVSERWNALRHCHEVFDRLSDAVLNDAIKIQSAAPDTLSQELGTSNPHSLMSSQTNPDGNQNLSDSGSYPSPINPGLQMSSSFCSSTSPLAVDSEFRNCFDDLQNLYDYPYVDDPVMQLSQDWLGSIYDFNGMMHPMMAGEYNV